MPRIPHGSYVNLDTLRDARAAVATFNNLVPGGVAALPDLTRVGYLFPELQADPGNLLAPGAATVDALRQLGTAMRDAPGPSSSGIPAAYTYLGQFIDHDITLEAVSGNLFDLADPNLLPLDPAVIASKIVNARTATLDLDSVYGAPAPRNGKLMEVGRVTNLDGGAIPTLRPAGKSDDNDLPREPRSPDPLIDRAARIGDPRNDENTIVAQLHTAFLRAHNALAATRSFDEAAVLLRQHYQWMVIHDFLDRIADPAIAAQVRAGNQVFDPAPDGFFMPLEFSVAAYRFGHTMVRGAYDFNVNFNLGGGGAIPATLSLLFTFSALSGQLGDFDTLPDNWIIEWSRVLGPAGNQARRLDTMLVEPLFELRSEIGAPLPGIAASLAARNLLRGYALRLPTGQAVAKALSLPVMTATELEAAAGNDAQRKVLRDSGLSARTPLWYYVLAEAAHAGGGNRLGPVGSTLVAEVLVGLARRSESSIFDSPGWAPTLGATAGTFTLEDLLRLAGVHP